MKYFNDMPDFMQVSEAYELDDKSTIVAEVLFKYTRDLGVTVSTVVWLDSEGSEISLGALPWHEQVWLVKDVEKLAKRHASTYFEDAFSHYELEK